MQLDIPYINLVGRSFWDMKHVADVIAYLQLAFDEENSAAFKRVYNIASSNFKMKWGKRKGEYCNHRWLGNAFLKACTPAGSKDPSYTMRWQASRVRRSYQDGVADMDDFVSSLQREIAAGASLAEILRVIIDDCYRDWLSADEGLLGGEANDNGKLDDLETVIEIASQHTNVKDFLAYVEQVRKSAQKAKDGDWSGHVVVSTIHRLKGTERPVVFGIGCVEGRNKKGMPVGLLPITYALRSVKGNGVIMLNNDSRMEDERDIMYVLVSRAQEECHLTGCQVYRDGIMKPSRFIHEMELV